jgi:hypothetical protein
VPNNDKDASTALAELISEYVNRYSGDRDKLAVALASDHPTLQQNFMRTVVVPFLREMAEKPYVDLRNEGSHELAKLLVKAMDENPIGLPFV